MTSPPLEPSPPDPSLARYAAAPFPRYRFIPGRSPHPRRDRAGHSFGLPEPRVQTIEPAAWAACELYLRGVDLFNFAYWWESHEAFEALWHGGPPGSAAAELLQALIQLAASEIKRFSDLPRPARALAGRALARLAAVPSPYLGLDIRGLARDVEDRLAGMRPLPPLLSLQLPAPRAGDE